MTKLFIFSTHDEQELLYKNLNEGDQIPRIGDTILVNNIKHTVVEIIFVYDSERPSVTNVQIWVEEK